MYPPSPPNYCWKMLHLFPSIREKSPDYKLKYCRWGRGELAWSTKFFCDCLREEFKGCHTTRKKKGFRKGELYHFAGTCTIASQQAPGEPEQIIGACKHPIDAAVIQFQLLVS